MEDAKLSPLSEQIRLAFDREEGEFTFRDFLAGIDTRSFGFLLVVLSIPSALPVPAPGYSVPFGIVLAVLATQLIARRAQPIFPERILNRRLKAKSDSRFVRTMAKFIGFFERFSRPRGMRWFALGPFERILGGMVLLCSISMMLPIPLTNTLPALGIFLIGMALLGKDLLFGILGLLVGLAGIALTTTLLVLISKFGMDGVDMVKTWIRGWF